LDFSDCMNKVRPVVNGIQVVVSGGGALYQWRAFSFLLTERAKNCCSKTVLPEPVSKINKKITISSYSFISSLADCVVLANRLMGISLGKRLKIFSGVGCAACIFQSGLTSWDDLQIFDDCKKKIKKGVPKEEQEKLEQQQGWALMKIVVNVVLAVWAIFNFTNLLVTSPEWVSLAWFFVSCTIGMGEIIYRDSIEKMEKPSPIASS
jgi:hypothetical protein